MPVINGLPVPINTRQISPRHAIASPPEHPIDHHPVIRPPTTPTRTPIGQQWLQPSPLIISQIMTIQHAEDLPHPAPELHRPRSSPVERVTGSGPRRYQSGSSVPTLNPQKPLLAKKSPHIRAMKRNPKPIAVVICQIRIK